MSRLNVNVPSNNRGKQMRPHISEKMWQKSRRAHKCARADAAVAASPGRDHNLRHIKRRPSDIDSWVCVCVLGGGFLSDI